MLIHEVWELLRHLAEARHQQLIAQEPASIYVAADPERIFHVFANLIGNSIKFTPEGGVITVGAVHRGDRCEFYVQDTGRGRESNLGYLSSFSTALEKRIAP